MKKMNKKGFTLIELLTVIAILAVILLIAAPTILCVLDKAKKSTFKNQVLMYVESLKTQVDLNSMGQSDMAAEDLSFSTTGEGLQAKTTATVDVTKIPMDSQGLTSGTITVTAGANGKYTDALTNVTDGSYCVTGVTDVTSDTDFTTEKITSGNCQ